MKLNPAFRGISKVEIHCGTTGLFWKDDWMHGVMSETYPQAFSFATDEDASVHKFLLTTELREAFWLPLSTRAHDETRRMQTEVADTTLGEGAHDKWSYVWGKAEFKSRDYYAFYYREV